jgi:hypothetical protein
MKNEKNLSLGHNVFDVDGVPKISLGLLSMAHQEDRAALKFGIVARNKAFRPVVLIDNCKKYIDLLTARELEHFGTTDSVEACKITYYDGCFTFEGANGETTFIDKNVLIKNYGFSIIP